MKIFQIYTTLRHQGGLEKTLLKVSEDLAKDNEVYIISDDEDFPMPNNVKHIYAPLLKGGIFNYIKSYFILKKIIKKHSPEICQSHHRLTTMLLTPLKKAFNFKLVHTAQVNFTDKKYFKYAKADVYIAVGHEVVRNLTEMFAVPKDKITIIYNSGEPFSVDESETDTLTNSAVVVGRLSEQKGHKYLVDAWVDVVKELPDAKVYFVGDGDLRPDIEAQIKANKLEESVILKGFMSPPQPMINKAEFLILPSLWEGLPLIVLEAFAINKTAVATAVDGTKEIILDGETGYIVPPKDPKALAEATIKMFKNKDKRKEMAVNANKLYQKHFTEEKMLSDYRNLLMSI